MITVATDTQCLALWDCIDNVLMKCQNLEKPAASLCMQNKLQTMQRASRHLHRVSSADHTDTQFWPPAIELCLRSCLGNAHSPSLLQTGGTWAIPGSRAGWHSTRRGTSDSPGWQPLVCSHFTDKNSGSKRLWVIFSPRKYGVRLFSEPSSPRSYTNALFSLLSCKGSYKATNLKQLYPCTTTTLTYL